ncbi:MAG: NAD(P)(+) transhydrogenase (Re/Si-specific) subunit beta [Alphaproteobacteria bacterium]|nr:NAD(P)(+) transhydrogenase (Re/Si-specific) subunit beta [Alphaproteobacteria bacterium]
MINNELFLIYLLVSILFIVAIRGLSKPNTALFSNRLGMAGMLLAIVATMFVLPEQNHIWILIAIFTGAVVGVLSATKVKITALPQMVAVFNGLGGLSSTLVAFAQMKNMQTQYLDMSLSVAIGTIAFMGSMIAYLKLQGSFTKILRKLPFHNVFNLALFIIMIFAWGNFLVSPTMDSLFYLMCFALLWSVAVTMPVGGADMPIVVSVLNACSGFAATAVGFSVSNVALIITGAIVGASGTILTFIMTKAINRSIWQVLFYNQTKDDDLKDTQDKTVRSASPEDAAFILENSSKIIIVPGFGMAASEAQFALKNMALILKNKYGASVKFAIHPVAGRMPGHMNVLLAEAGIDYEDVFEMDDINPEFATADVAYVIGANDITNPAAKTLQTSPLYGMPVLDVYKAKTVFFVKRTLGSGYSKTDNPLFFADNTMMIFGDAKKVTENIVKDLEQG